MLKLVRQKLFGRAAQVVRVGCGAHNLSQSDAPQYGIGKAADNMAKPKLLQWISVAPSIVEAKGCLAVAQQRLRDAAILAEGGAGGACGALLRRQKIIVHQRNANFNRCP